MNELSLFTGAGGGLLGTKLLGWKCVCAVEIEPYCQEVLVRRQADGWLDPFPIWPDVRTFDGAAWRGRVDVVTAGFPCQPFSSSGKRKGADDLRNGWPHTARILGEVRPSHVLLENVAGLVSTGYIRTVLGDLAELGFDARWSLLSAAHDGAPQARERVWIAAHVDGGGRERLEELHGIDANARRRDDDDGLALAQRRARSAPSRIRRVGDAVANRMDRTRAAGNGQVPRMVARAWRALSVCAVEAGR